MTTWAELLERSSNAPGGSTAYERMIFGSLDDDSFDALIDLSTSNPGSTAWIHLRDSLIGVTVLITIVHTVVPVIRDFQILSVFRDWTVRQTSRLFNIGAQETRGKTVKFDQRTDSVDTPSRSREEGPDVF